MIQLHPDYLFVQQENGEMIPCSAESITFEVTQDPDSPLDPEWIQQAALAVLHYFKTDLCRNYVTVQEFSTAMQRVILALCCYVRSTPDGKLPMDLPSNLQQLVSESQGGFELAFFQRLRAELLSKMEVADGPRMLLFEGLRPCVKQLLGAKRWNPQCQRLNDQIVEFLRECFLNFSEKPGSKLVIR